MVVARKPLGSHRMVHARGPRFRYAMACWVAGGSAGFECRESEVFLDRIGSSSRASTAASRHMRTVASAGNDPRTQKVRVTKNQIIADLVDGRVISVPLAWSWRLSEATPVQRANFRLIGTGQGVHWPDVDEDISVEGLLRGTPARRPELRQ